MEAGACLWEKQPQGGLGQVGSGPADPLEWGGGS